MTEDIKMLREALEMAAEHYEPLGTRRAEELLAALDRVVAERDRSQRNHEDACQCIAEMHAAAIGRWGGPVGRGVVEDVAALRTALQTIRDATYDTETAEHELLRGEVRHTAEDALALSSATPPPEPCVPAETLEEMLRALFHLRDPNHTQQAQDAAYRGKAALDILARRLREAQGERDALRERLEQMEDALRIVNKGDSPMEETAIRAGEREACARAAEAEAERIKHTAHNDGLGMGWQPGEEVAYRIAAILRASSD